MKGLKRYWGLVATLSLVATPFAALAQQNGSVLIYNLGIGSNSCAYWLSNPVFDRDGRNWVLGYWSGLNVNAAHPAVGVHSDAEGIWGEVKKICVAEPSTPLSSAVMDVYTQFERDGK